MYHTLTVNIIGFNFPIRVTADCEVCDDSSGSDVALPTMSFGAGACLQNNPSDIG